MYLFKNQLTTCMFLIILSLLGSIVVKQNKSCNWRHEWEKDLFYTVQTCALVPGTRHHITGASTAGLRKLSRSDLFRFRGQVRTTHQNFRI